MVKNHQIYIKDHRVLDLWSYNPSTFFGNYKNIETGPDHTEVLPERHMFSLKV